MDETGPAMTKREANQRRSLEAFLARTGAQLWIQHDYAADAKLKKAPAYYD